VTARRPNQREWLTEARGLFYLESRLAHEYVDGKCCIDNSDRQIMLEIVKDIIADRDPRDRFSRGLRGRKWLDTIQKQVAAVAIGITVSDGQRPSEDFLDEIANCTGLTFDQVKHIHRRVSKKRKPAR
jgi:hypothetical protein